MRTIRAGLAFLVATAATVSVSGEGGGRSLLADLPLAVHEALPVDLDPPLAARPAAEQLERVFAASTPYEFDVGAVVVETDPRWFSTLTPGTPASSILELRRWPGDTRLLLYAVQAPIAAVRGGEPPVDEADFTLQEGASESYAEWHGVIHTPLGDAPAIWIEAPTLAGSPTALGALLLPGDAGLGDAAVPDLTQELRSVLGRISFREQLWPRQPALPHGATIPLGATVSVPGAHDENLDPWQVATGTDFTIGLPPGVQARRTDAGVPPPVEVPGGRLWLRGRFTDIEGETIILGDATRAGYVAEIPGADPAWAEGQRAPLGAPTAASINSAPFSLLREPFTGLRKDAGVTAVVAGRWAEPGFAGEWLVFRLQLPDRGVEIGLPMLAGRRSPSLFWIPATWRPSALPPAAPPVDPAARFGIKWERLTRGELSRRPWVEGILTVPGLKAELPLDWWPASTLRSRDGFPIRLIGPEGVTVARIVLADAAAVAALLADSPERTAEGAEVESSATPDGGPPSRWTARSRPGVHGAAAVWARGDGARLFVAREGHGFLFEVAGDGVAALEWERLESSVQLVRSGR